jgi:hypothetical protein
MVIFGYRLPISLRKIDRDIFMFSNQPHTPQGLPIPAYQPQPPQNDRSISPPSPKLPTPAHTIAQTIAKLEVAHALPGVRLEGRSLGAKLSPITYQNLIRVIGGNPNFESSVSHNSLKGLTQAENKSLIDQTKEVMSDKWCFKRKKTPTWKKEF